MVLTEAFAAGTPVIASAIAGYSDVVTDGLDGVLVPPGDPQRLAEELQRAYHEPERLKEMGEAARKSADRYAWPHVADRVTEVYEQAIEAPSRSRPGKGSPHGPVSGRPTATRRRPASGCRPWIRPSPRAAIAGAVWCDGSRSAGRRCSVSA
jgi:phosphatidylinositol alpha-mannosyltransferase